MGLIDEHQKLALVDARVEIALQMDDGVEEIVVVADDDVTEQREVELELEGADLRGAAPIGDRGLVESLAAIQSRLDDGFELGVIVFGEFAIVGVAAMTRAKADFLFRKEVGVAHDKALRL